MVLDSSNKGDECASAHAFGKDFTRAVRVAAEKLAHREMKDDLAASTRHIVDRALVLTVNMVRGAPTARTVRDRPG